MSMPSPDYSQQILAYLEVWREILEQSTAAAARLTPTLPTGIPFMPSMPTSVPSMPPMPPVPPAGSAAQPAPADYAQQLFRYLQAWRQYLEQMTGAIPASAQPPSAHQGEQYPPTTPTPPGKPPLIDKPPVYGDESADPSAAAGPVSNSNLSLPPNNEGGTASLYGRSRPAEASGVWPPNNGVLVRPATEGGTMVPSSYGNKIDPADAIKSPTGPVTDSRGGGPAATHVLRPPIYDWATQWLPGFRGPDVRRAAVTPDTRAQRITDTPVRRTPSPAQVTVDVPSSHRAAMDRVTLDATPKVDIKSNFKERGQAG